MKTKAEIIYAFTPQKCDGIQSQKIMRVEMAFKELVTEVEDLVPVSPDRTAALRKLLEAKMTCVQAITHPIASPSQPAPSEQPPETPSTLKGKKPNGKKA